MKPEYPLGNRNYAWKWNGINPIHPFNLGTPLFSKLKEFQKCFKYAGGIGTFAFWDLIETGKLSCHQKEKLINLLENEYKEYTC